MQKALDVKLYWKLTETEDNMKTEVGGVCVDYPAS